MGGPRVVPGLRKPWLKLRNVSISPPMHPLPPQMGAYHTLDLELQRNFTISKQCWDTVVLDRLEEACDPVKQVSGGWMGLLHAEEDENHSQIDTRTIIHPTPTGGGGRRGDAAGPGQRVPPDLGHDHRAAAHRRA